MAVGQGWSTSLGVGVRPPDLMVRALQMHVAHAEMRAVSVPWVRRGRQPIAFIGVGALNSVVGLAGYTLGLTVLHAPYLWALVVGHVFSVALAYPLQRRVVFRVCGRIVRDFCRYEMVTGSVVLLNGLFLYLLVSSLKTPHLAAEVLVTGVLALASYVAHRDFSFERG